MARDETIMIGQLVLFIVGTQALKYGPFRGGRKYTVSNEVAVNNQPSYGYSNYYSPYTYYGYSQPVEYYTAPTYYTYPMVYQPVQPKRTITIDTDVSVNSNSGNWYHR